MKRLEPDEGKLSSPVLRGGVGGNAVSLPDHPSGVAEPSEADKFITQRLKQALGLLDIRVLDHFVIGAEGIYSFAEHGHF